MAETHLPRAAPDDVWLQIPGQWRPANRDGARTVIVSCPDCGQSASLSGHQIDASGKVTPSLVCPYTGCLYHEWIVLDGWVATTEGGEKR